MSPLYSLERRLAYRFSMLSTMNMRWVGARYTKKFGLSTAGWRVMSIIGRYEPIFPGVAAQRTTMDADKVTRAVDALVEMGYVIRNADAADRRRVILCLTSRGRAVYEEVEEMHQAVDAKWRMALTREENAILDGLIDKLEARSQELFAEVAGAKTARAPKRAVPAKKVPAAASRKRATA